jgi:hypothetical protein
MRMRLVLLRRRKEQRPPRSPGRWPEGPEGMLLIGTTSLLPKSKRWSASFLLVRIAG